MIHYIISRFHACKRKYYQILPVLGVINMRLTTKGRYGVRAVVNLATASQNRPISISHIAREEELSPEFLEQIFFKLKKAGVIRSLRGPKGGFVLNKKPAEITIKMILDAVGEPLYPAPCTDSTAEKRCKRMGHCPISPMWQSFYDMIEEFLGRMKVKDIIDKNQKK